MSEPQVAPRRERGLGHAAPLRLRRFTIRDVDGRVLEGLGEADGIAWYVDGVTVTNAEELLPFGVRGRG